jgi:hypothetical protein
MSVVRPFIRTQDALCRPFDVAASNTVRKGMPVKLSSGKVVEATAVTDNIIGIARDAGDAAGTSGLKQIGVYMHGGIVPALVGTGGATDGVAQRASASGDGITDATTGGGTGKIVEVGIAVIGGTGAAVAGDIIGLNLNITPTVGS